MKKKIISLLLVAALVTAGNATAASAAVPTGTGTAGVYSPTEIIDVVVPTHFKLAFNPMKVAVKNDDYNASTEILSGTYAIQNRSTIPMQVEAAFKVTPGTQAKNVTAEQVAADNAETDATKVSKMLAEFSLDVQVSAVGAVPTLPTAIDAKADDSKDDARTVTAVEGNASTNIIKIGKASTETLPLVTSTGDKIKFMLDKGPYKLVYDKDTDKVTYQVSTGTFDTVAFTFTGTTLQNTEKWNKVTTAPKVDVTYTLTQQTAGAYAATPFNLNSKAVVQEKGDVEITSGGTAAKAYVFAKKPSVAMDITDPTVPKAGQKVTIQSLVKNAKADATNALESLGTYEVDTTDAANPVYKYTVNDQIGLDQGYYKVTVGGQFFVLKVK